MGKLLEEEQSQKPERKKIFFNSAADRKHCSNCIYRSVYNTGYICNFFLITGARRNCPAGAGCIRKEIDPRVQVARARDIFEKTCERCGSTFIGTKKAHYCLHCRGKHVKKVS